jgi:hypothetical protein
MIGRAFIRRFLSLHLWMVPGCLLIGVTPGQAAEPSGEPASAAVQPPVPVVRSPIHLFRELMLQSPEDRERFLAGRSGPARDQILKGLREFEALEPDERELRLRMMELRWYLRPLLELAPEPRSNALSRIPEPERGLVEGRLALWDQLSPEAREELLDHELTIHYLVRLEGISGDGQTALLQRLPEEQRRQIVGELDRLRALPEETRRRMYRHFQEFFELTAEEKRQALGSLTEAERQEMEESLQAFEKLPAALRRHCIEAFRKFADLPPDERRQFLRNADRWAAMSATERHAWRELVRRVPPMPPLPQSVKLPPLPPGATTGSPAIVTNSAR